MTTIAAPPRRARGSATRAPVRARRPAAVHTAPRAARPAMRRFTIGRLGGILALVTVFALVSAVLFHVVLAQHQLQLDRLNTQISEAQHTYETRRLSASLLASPARIIQEAQRLGLVLPDAPAEYLAVPDAPLPKADDGSTVDTLADWSRTKSSLGVQQP